jgi:hypothetical protein
VFRTFLRRPSSFTRPAVCAVTLRFQL